MTTSRTLHPGPSPRRLTTANGELVDVPAGWELLPPGDAGLTRRVKAAGPSWVVVELRGRKRFSRGLWAPADNIASARAALELERADPRHAQKLASSRARREREQAAYVAAFHAEVLEFLAFAPGHAALADALARAIVAHATPVGSGTVARTERIPIERRAEAAVIAWLRHQTTEYDTMKIPRVKGMRREVRRLLAERSRAVLQRYRSGLTIEPGQCVLRRALERAS